MLGGSSTTTIQNREHSQTEQVLTQRPEYQFFTGGHWFKSNEPNVWDEHDVGPFADNPTLHNTPPPFHQSLGGFQGEWFDANALLSLPQTEFNAISQNTTQTQWEQPLHHLSDPGLLLWRDPNQALYHAPNQTSVLGDSLTTTSSGYASQQELSRDQPSDLGGPLNLDIPEQPCGYPQNVEPARLLATGEGMYHSNRMHSTEFLTFSADGLLWGMEPSSVSIRPAFPTTANLAAYRDVNPLEARAAVHNEHQRSETHRIPCPGGCNKSFKSPKDLAKHYKAKFHAKPGHKVYKCRCGFDCARKDNYSRHLKQRSCIAKHPSYTCICSRLLQEADLERHLQHLKACTAGRRKLGRPRKRWAANREAIREAIEPYRSKSAR